jgi:Cu/Ag efflux protein CusF
MKRAMSSIVIGILIFAAGLSAQEGIQKAKVKKIDLDKLTVTLTVGDKDRTFNLDEQTRVFGAEGKNLKERFAGLKEGTEVMFKADKKDGKEVLIGLKPVGAASAPPNQLKVDTSKLKPLTEMTAEDKYKGEDGGLYGGGKNEPPATHLGAAKKEAAMITTLDKDGKPAKNGKIVLVSISMSNATNEFSKFKQIADADPQKSPQLTIVDCAQGGQTMAMWAQPQAKAWDVAERRLKDAGVDPKQVQIAWIKLANAGPQGDLTEHAKKLQADTVAVIHNAKTRYPNLRIAYLDSRIYAGYATTGLNPEPYAYEGAFAVRWLIRDQIKGDANLNYDAEKGAVKAPLLLWGAYLWGNGTTARKSDGLVWERKDLAGDGTHPTESGRQKVAELLLKFFKTDPTAKPWFVK